MKIREIIRRDQILLFLCKVGLADRAKIVAELNEPRTTVYDTLKQMFTEELIGKCAFNNGLRGRSKVLWTIRQKGREAASIE